MSLRDSALKLDPLPVNYVHFWGQAADKFPASLPKRLRPQLSMHHQYSWYFYYQRRDDLVECLERIKTFSRQEGVIIAIPSDHNKDTALELPRWQRTVAYYELSYKGKTYSLFTDFGYEYKDTSADYMLMEGNYSCDCNRSNFIREIDPTFPSLKCGDEIVMSNYRIVHED